MAYYTTCSICGCTLDPGEKCDCEEETARKLDILNSHLKMEEGIGQMSFDFDKWESEREVKLSSDIA